jgi:hypothetical protein
LKREQELLVRRETKELQKLEARQRREQQAGSSSKVPMDSTEDNGDNSMAK